MIAATPEAPRTAVFPPGVRHLTPFPFMRALRADPLEAFGAVLRQHGDAAGIRGGPIQVVLLARPEHARHVLIRNARNYGKGPQIAKLRRIAGDGVFFVDGDEWRRQRRMIVPAFQRARVEALVPHMVAGADAMLARWRTQHAGGASFDATPDLSKLALDVVCRAMFGSDVREHADAFHAHAAVAARYAQYLFEHVFPLPRWIPNARNRRMREAMRWVNGFIHEMIDAHRRPGAPADDLLGLLLRVRDEETGAALSDAELFDELMTFVNAGHETTAVSLAWSLYEIGRDAALRARLEAEVDAQLGAAQPELAQLARLDLLGRTIREVLRLHPPGWALPRQALARDEIDGVLIPRGATVLVAVYFLHRHPELWSDPECFDPDRWLPERGEPRHAFAYLPFGLGGRRCVGEDFALLELRAVLARILQRWRVELDPAHPVVARPELTLKPAHGVRLRIRARAPA
ncbi:MAG TPA: cytochrome P450 [Myxococcota bacterium]|nr:cytochrome P450 [Myxococcota bacterium]